MPGIYRKQNRKFGASQRMNFKSNIVSEPTINHPVTTYSKTNYPLLKAIQNKVDS